MHHRRGRIAIVDSGFWIALLDERDQHYEEAQTKADVVRSLAYILPWPILYETLNTRLMRRPHLVRSFVKSFLKRPNACVLDDAPYRDSALEATLSQDFLGKRAVSLVDAVLRQIIVDPKVKVNCIVTFNVADFSDLCKRHTLEIL